MPEGFEGNRARVPLIGGAGAKRPAMRSITHDQVEMTFIVETNHTSLILLHQKLPYLALGQLIELGKQLIDALVATRSRLDGRQLLLLLRLTLIDRLRHA